MAQVKIYRHVINGLIQAQVTALEQTAAAMLSEVQDEQVIPKHTGALDDSTFVDINDSQSGVVSIISNEDYARRLYFHPEYNFSKTVHPNAQGRWLEDWITGDKKNFCKEEYAKIYKALTGV